jgi:hypothetical protein
MPVEDLAPLQHLSELTSLYLMNCHRLADLRPLATLPNLRMLALDGAAPGLDLSPLATNHKLTITIRAGQDVRGAESFGSRLQTR